MLRSRTRRDEEREAIHGQGLICGNMTREKGVEDSRDFGTSYADPVPDEQIVELAFQPVPDCSFGSEYVKAATEGHGTHCGR